MDTKNHKEGLFGPLGYVNACISIANIKAHGPLGEGECEGSEISGFGIWCPLT